MPFVDSLIFMEISKMNSVLNEVIKKPCIKNNAGSN